MYDFARRAAATIPFATLEFGVHLGKLAVGESGDVASPAAQYFEKLGVETIVCGRLPEHKADLESGFWLNSRPASWNEAYIRQGFIKHDPVLQELCRTPRALSWSDAITRRRLGAGQRAVMALAMDFGMREGFVVPIFDGHGTSGIVSLAGRELDLSADGRIELQVAAVLLHNALCARRAADRGPPRLTDRETEVVKWIIAGKSDWQIGKILHISAKTVNFHVENVKRKFGVATRIQAVVAAVRDGNIRI